MRGGVAALAFCGAMAVAATSAAQTQPARTGPNTPGGRALSIGGIYTAPSSMGSANAELLGANGKTSVTLFSTQNTMASGFGPELLFGFRSGRASFIEVGTGIVWTTLKTDVTKDLETTSTPVVSASVVRWTAEGAVVWLIHDNGKSAWFVRAGGGLMGEASSDLSTSEIGFTAGGGVGWRHWWRANGTGAVKRLGLRAEFRANAQSGGISLTSSTTRFVAAGTAHLVIGLK